MWCATRVALSRLIAILQLAEKRLRLREVAGLVVALLELRHRTDHPIMIRDGQLPHGVHGAEDLVEDLLDEGRGIGADRHTHGGQGPPPVRPYPGAGGVE